MTEAHCPHPSLASAVERLAKISEVTELLEAAVREACRVSNGDRAVALQRDSLTGLGIVAQHNAELDDDLPIGDLRSSLWQVLLGRTELCWDTTEEAPYLFRHMPGWTHGAVVQLPATHVETKLLAVGDPERPINVGTLRLFSTITSGFVERNELADQRSRDKSLVRRVTELAGELGAAVSPTALLDALINGLSKIERIEEVSVWSRTSDKIVRLTPLKATSPLATSNVKQRLELLTLADVDPVTKHLLETASRATINGQYVTLARIDSTSVYVVGIAHTDPLDELEQNVLTSLVASSEPAILTVQMAAERRSLVTKYARSLWPRRRPSTYEMAVEHHPNISAPGTFGGDFFDCFEIEGEPREVIALGDVSGKGLDAAASAGMAVWTLRALGNLGLDPVELIGRLHNVVEREVETDQFITLALMYLNTEDWEVELILAGHPLPFIVERGTCRTIGVTTSPPLGVSSLVTARPVRFTLDQGQALVLYTDGLTEAVNGDGKRWGTDRAMSCAEAAMMEPLWTPGSVASALWEGALRWAGGHLDDDCAVLVIRRPS